MTLDELDLLRAWDRLDPFDAADRAEANRTRIDAIMGAPEAEGRQLVAFALLLRLDLSPQTAVLFLRQAPPLRTAAEVSAYVEAIPLQPTEETRQ